MPERPIIGTEERWTIESVPMRDRYAEPGMPWQSVRMVVRGPGIPLGESIEVVPVTERDSLAERLAQIATLLEPPYDEPDPLLENVHRAASVARVALVPSTDDTRKCEPLTPVEAHELFSMYMECGIRPPEIDPRHPLVTGANKLAAMQADDPEGFAWKTSVTDDTREENGG